METKHHAFSPVHHEFNTQILAHEPLPRTFRYHGAVTSTRHADDALYDSMERGEPLVFPKETHDITTRPIHA